MVIEKSGLDGILYPSVRTGGDGFNIALTPKSMEKIELVSVIESEYIISKGEVKINNIKKTENMDGLTSFELKKIE